MFTIAISEVGFTALANLPRACSYVSSLGAFFWAAIFLVLLYPFTSIKSKKCTSTEATGSGEPKSLFPLIDRTGIHHESVDKEWSEDFPQPCSTGLTTRLLPFKNDNGEIEWAFTEDAPQHQELDVFEVDPAIAAGKFSSAKQTKSEKESETLSPVTSASSNNDSLNSRKNDSSISPQVNTPSSSSSDDHKEEDGDGESHTYQCPHCDTSFKMRGYLTRHLKKHSTEKAYKCPFHKISFYRDENDNTHKCHPSGGFSRRDTYKTHLKSRHFRYPQGTPIKSRNSSPGNCSMCGEWFQNAEIWSELHIEGAECKYLPIGFKGKSRIKNRLKKQMARLVKEQQKLKGSSTEGSQASFDHNSPVFSTPNSINTPIIGGSSQYDDERSPSQSSSSSVGQHMLLQQSLNGQPVRRFQPTHIAAASPLHDQVLSIESHALEHDYDDEFCLDTEQMSMPVKEVHLYPQQSQFSCNGFQMPGHPQPNRATFSPYIH